MIKHLWNNGLAVLLIFVGSVRAQEPLNIGDILLEPVKTEAAAPDKVITMVVTKFAFPNSQYPIIYETISRLQKVFGEDRFQVKVYSGETSDIGQADLVLSSSGTFTRMKLIGAKDLASVISRDRPDPNHAEGSVFVALKSRTDLHRVSDMQNKVVVSTGPNAFSGYHIALGELADQGYDPDHFFKKRVSSGYDMRKVLASLREGKADIGVVRTCFLEELNDIGGRTEDIKVIGQKSEKAGRCVTSTRLYPNWTLFATPCLSASDARETALALLSMPPDKNGLAWGLVSDFSSNDDLYKKIKEGPYRYLREWTWERIRQEYGVYLVIALFCLLALAAHTVRTSYLVEKRTSQLKEALRKQKITQDREREAQVKIQTLQKIGAIGQMSSIIAHELRQPLATIMNYSHGLQRLLEQEVNADVISEGLSKMQQQAEKAEAIVSKVRAYAKGKEEKRNVLNFRALTRESVRLINESKLSKHKVVFQEESKKPVYINGEPVEIELCIVNLIKNALEATPVDSNAVVQVRLEEQVAVKLAVFTVRDSGERLSDEEFSKLSEPLQSKKIEGLGLGLAIVKLIVANHKGKLIFTRLPERGIEAKLIFPSQMEKP